MPFQMAKDLYLPQQEKIGNPFIMFNSFISCKPLSSSTGVYTPGTWRPFLNAQGSGKMSAGITGGSGVASSQGIAGRTHLS